MSVIYMIHWVDDLLVFGNSNAKREELMSRMEKPNGGKCTLERMALNGHNGYQPPAQRLAAWLVGYVPANGPTVRWGQTPRVGICPPLWVGQPPAAPRSFRQLPVQTGSQRLANPTVRAADKGEPVG